MATIQINKSTLNNRNPVQTLGVNFFLNGKNQAVISYESELEVEMLEFDSIGFGNSSDVVPMYHYKGPGASTMPACVAHISSYDPGKSIVLSVMDITTAKTFKYTLNK